jgi:hypothetical protein
MNSCCHLLPKHFPQLRDKLCSACCFGRIFDEKFMKQGEIKNHATSVLADGALMREGFGNITISKN